MTITMHERRMLNRYLKDYWICGADDCTSNNVQACQKKRKSVYVIRCNHCGHKNDGYLPLDIIRKEAKRR